MPLSSHGAVAARKPAESENDEGDPALLNAFVAETGVDPTTDPFIVFAFECACLRRQFIRAAKVAAHIASKGAAKGAVLMPKSDYGFRGIGKEFWAALHDAVLAPRGQQRRLAAKALTAFDILVRGGAIPPIKRGQRYDRDPARVFVFSVCYLREATGQPGWSAGTLYNLTRGLGLVKPCSSNDYGHLRLSHWGSLVRAARSIKYEPVKRTDGPVETYFLEATARFLTYDKNRAAPSPEELAAYIQSTLLPQSLAPWPSWIGNRELWFPSGVAPSAAKATAPMSSARSPVAYSSSSHSVSSHSSSSSTSSQPHPDTPGEGCVARASGVATAAETAGTRQSSR